ncbi:DNA repair protein RecN [Rickettsia prowazekii str. GvV257]|uniref:DNA repair protein RecN n=2 Tax=Rickettsia prowazekii TaxID=782 RepID=RECN_RICPR|nr:DNA repair protein RecN [Rickettsia prowazekii]Q9ZDY2.1 RecName: Full=DNA repair protein RecN; AltName: Full=Recombination protein N [Rickettsia prowazekii str. Madrid E]ADE29692.1 DNA repair protein RecN [Rickettsia prowazekii str. Rp22]AFE49002.1 DNA repair protein RecN [Rickettsia prowazekii str. Chernikova]AFE49848.1 DNA repair protein RecN [Rickettsia prowazekii str. Katsinyian]AFE50692.1 DNA repair protein RecN [Rickettsia prowazekii str. BuV67-CWPP]AFE51532.1 DNA repair protein RecN
MFYSLSVKNFILIDELEIEFSKGLCVITGETGAGKSILLDAILFCLGYKTSNNIIKHGKDYTVVNIIFSLNEKIKKFLIQNFIEPEELLLVKCLQKAEGRKSFFINNQIVTKTLIKQLANYLFELHGQNNNITLLEASTQRDILDSYGDLLEFRVKLAKCYQIWQNTRKEIEEITVKQNVIEQEIDYLNFVTEELTKLNIQIGEEETLTNIRQDLQNKNKDLQLIRDIIAQINNPEINISINRAEKLLARQRDNDRFKAIATSLEEAYNNLEVARQELSNLLDSFTYEEYNLEETEERLFLIKAISRKYNVPANELGIFLDKSLEKLVILKNKIANSHKLQAQEVLLQEQYYKLANDLSARRLIAAKHLEESLNQELKQLKMEKANFKIEIKTAIDPTASGNDDIVFKASTNPGMKAEEINKIASGGELSRFMLALKTSLFDKMIKPSIIFDEIDVGIGGEAADKVGDRLKKLSSVTQVIVITHQPQVAGKADLHIKIEKTQLEQETKIKVKALNLAERQRELARMISGKTITDASLKVAKELLYPVACPHDQK